MVNPFYFLFYLLFKILGNPLKRESNDAFVSYSVVILLLAFHLLFLFLAIKIIFAIPQLPNINHQYFAILFLPALFGSSYFLFEKNNRYVKVLRKIKDASKIKRQRTVTILVIYFSLPIILLLYNLIR